MRRPAHLHAVLLCALLALLPACKKQPSAAATAATGPSREWLDGALPKEANEGTPRSGGVLVVRLPAEPAMLNRLHDSGQDGWATRVMLGQVCETLLQLDREDAPHHHLLPLLAEKWEVSPDGRNTTFHLRTGVTFHNGEPFSAKDVKAVLDAVMDPKNPTTSLRADLTELQSWETPDESTVVLHWKRPAPTGTRNFAITVPMVPASALKGDFDALAINRAPIGTGPFKFGGWETNKAITLVRNDAYWGRKAYLDKVVLRIVKDHTVATQMFERGEFDLMTFILPSVWRALEKPDPKNAWAQDGYWRLRYPENSYSWIGWNEARPFFRDKLLRRAMTYLVPTGVIFENVTLGLEPTTTCPFYSQGPHCDPALEAQDSKERLRYDPARGKALLSQLGWRDTDGDGVLDKDGVPFKFTFLIYAHSVSSGKIAPLLQEELRKAGIDMDIERVEWAVYTERLRRHEFDAVTLGWTTMDVETDVFSTFHTQKDEGGTNYVSYSNPEVDALIEQARATFDDARRVELDRRIHRLLYEDQVYTFLGVRTALDAVKTRVRGVRPFIGWYRLADIWLAPEKT